MCPDGMQNLTWAIPCGLSPGIVPQWVTQEIEVQLPMLNHVTT